MRFCDCGAVAKSSDFCEFCMKERKEILAERQARKKEMAKTWWMRSEDDKNGTKASRKKRKHPRCIR